MISELQAWLPRLDAVIERLGIASGPVDFQIVDADTLYELAAYGFPGQLPHWTHGRDYWDQKRALERGRGRLYEMIVNTEPPQAYLLDGNTRAAQQLVMAHCYGHAYIFRRHSAFADGWKSTPADLLWARERVRAYTAEYGAEAVEAVLDAALPWQWYVEEDAPDTPAPKSGGRLAGPYDRLFAAPPSRKAALGERVPKYRWPTRDILGFVARHSPVLEDWERDLCDLVRRQALYLRPQRGTKMIHEGFAAWANQHALLDPEIGLSDADQVEAARIWAQVVRRDPVDLNPYALGWELYEWLIRVHGAAAAREIWLTETDASVIRNYVTAETVRDLKLYAYQWESAPYDNVEDARVVEASWEAIRDALANAVASPIVPIELTGLLPQGGLRLEVRTHEYSLDRAQATTAVRGLALLWGGPVVLQQPAGGAAIQESGR